MSADILREAAALMRSRAEAATSDICPEWTRQAVRHVARNCEIVCAYSHDDAYPITVPHDREGDSEAQWDRYDDAAHIASWHPAVALAVADWLDMVAGMRDESHGGPLEMAIRALTEPADVVARAYLGASS